MKKITNETTQLVTLDEAIEGLTARVKELEMKKQKGGMTVPKMRDIDRQLRTAKAKLRQLSAPPGKPASGSYPKKDKSVKAAMASYLEKKAALLRQLGLKNCA